MAKRKAILRSDYSEEKKAIKGKKKANLAEPAVDAVGEGFKPLWTEPTSLINNRLVMLKDEFNKDLEYWRPDRLRFSRNARMYWATDYGQWAEAIVQRLINEGREPFQANIAAEKVETILAQTMQNPFDMTFKPNQQVANPRIGTLSNLAISLYLNDKNQMPWQKSQLLTYLFALVQEGCEELVIDTKRSEGLPRLMFKFIDPLYYLRDPNWESMDPYDMMKFWKFTMMSVEEMISAWPEHKEELTTERDRQRFYNDTPEYRGAYEISDYEERWGAKHRVIEKSYIVEEQRWWEYDLRHNRPFPETGFKNQGDDDLRVKREYIQKMGLNPGVRMPDGQEQDGDIAFINQNKRVEKKCVFVPTLSLSIFLEEGNSQIQVGRISKFPLGLSQWRQQYKGVMDSIGPINTMLNRTEMSMADIISRSARGAVGIDPAGVAPENRAAWEQNWNNPGFRGWTEEGYLQGGGKLFEPFPQGTVSTDMFSMSSHMIELMDIVGKTPAAGHGRLEQKQTSGKLFTAQYQAGLVASGLWYQNIEQHEKDKCEAWLRQGRITYAGPEREFSDPKSKDSIRINERVIGPNGIEVINDMSELPVMSVTIVPSPKGTTFQDANRELYAYMMQNLSPDQAFLRTLFMGELYKNMPNISEEKREETEKAINMQLEVLGLDMTANKMMLEGKIRMLKQQMQEQMAAEQQMAGGGGPPGMGGGGMPPPGMGGGPEGGAPMPPPPGAGGQAPVAGGPDVGMVANMIRQMGPQGVRQ